MKNFFILLAVLWGASVEASSQFVSGQYGYNLVGDGSDVQVEVVTKDAQQYPIFNSVSQKGIDENGRIIDVTVHFFKATEEEVSQIEGIDSKNLCEDSKTLVLERIHGDRSKLSCVIGLYSRDMHVTGLGQTPYDGSRRLTLVARINVPYPPSRVPISVYVKNTTDELKVVAIH